MIIYTVNRYSALPLFFGLAIMGFFGPRAAPPKLIKVSFIDVGIGACVLIQTPGGKNILIDGGLRETGGPKLIAYLKSKNIRKLDGVIVSSPAVDYVGGILAVISGTKIMMGDVLAPTVDYDFLQMENEQNFSPEFQELAEAIMMKQDALAARGHIAFDEYVYADVLAGHTTAWDPNVEFTFLSPQKSVPAPNRNSIVLKVKYRNVSFLFCSLIDSTIEKVLLKKKYLLPSTVIKVPYHGKETASMPSFVGAVKPRYAIFGPRVDVPTPNPAVLKRYLNSGAKTLDTSVNGTIEILSDGAKIMVKKER